MTYISEYFYSNCLIEAVKAKIRHPIKIKIKYIPARLNEVFCPHLIWHDELQDKTCNMIQDMLMTKYGINWNDFTVPCKRGTACIKVATKVTENIKREPQPFGEDKVTTTIIEERPIWAIDKNMPILKGEDRKYVDDLIYIGEE